MSARQSTIMVAMVARTQVVGTASDMCMPRESMTHVDRVEQKFGLNAEQGRAMVIEKVMALYSSRDHATSNPIDDAREHMRGLPGFDQLLFVHQRKWAHLWHRCDMNLGNGQEDVNRILRLHIFHLLQVVSPHLVGRDAGVPARGLHGEAYRGHIFWDELFVLPFLTSRLPEMTRQLLMYRYRRLPAARRLARLSGYQGAVFPWQSGSTGQEESQLLHINPRSGRWVPDETHLQRHINAAIAWNVWQYYETTGDHEFLGTYGAEMLVEIARFWASLATWDENLGRYRICGIVGPDEFHTSYPGSDRLGIDDNAYTNIMAAWCLRCVERALDDVGEDRRRELLEELQVTDAQRRQWARVAQKLRVVFFSDGHVISQFDGYADLKEIDWESYRSRYGDIHRLDRILEAEGDNVGRYQISKQADVLMLLYLFSGEELQRLLKTMGYSFDPAWIPQNIDYYLKRTSDGSTLSRVVHSWVLARSDRRRSFRLFKEALLSDVADIQGGTTAEGIHLGAMAGTVDLLQRGYTGAVVRDGILWLDPRLPHSLAWLRLRYQVRGAWIDLLMTQQEVDVGFSAGHASLARVGIAGRVHELQRGERRRFPVIGTEAQVIPIAINL
jgi:trehalose/maltose hydrolase-like predicted phosphorylase